MIATPTALALALALALACNPTRESQCSMRAPRPFFFAQVTATRLVRVGWGRERPYLLLSRPKSRM